MWTEEKRARNGRITKRRRVSGVEAVRSYQTGECTAGRICTELAGSD